MPKEPTPEQKDELLNHLIDSAKTGTFLRAVYERTLDQDLREWLPTALSLLHNRNEIDVVSEFIALKNHDGDYDFFLTRHVFEAVLPNLDADVPLVMQCVIHLTNEAGHDMAAGMLFPPYQEFCSKDPQRPSVALEYIKQNPEFMDLLSPTIVAGTRFDEKESWAETVALVGSGHTELKKRAIIALGRMEYAEGSPLVSESMALLSKINADETDDEVLASVLQASFAILQQDRSLASTAVELANSVLNKAKEYSLHKASEIFGLHTKDVPAALASVFISHLTTVNHENIGTLDNIDYALADLINREDPTIGVYFLENLLVANREIRIAMFDSAARELLKNKNDLLDRLATRWLARGTLELCRVLPDLLDLKHDESAVHLQVVPEELVDTDLPHLLFAARKAVGYPFFHTTHRSNLSSFTSQTAYERPYKGSDL